LWQGIQLAKSAVAQSLLLEFVASRRPSKIYVKENLRIAYMALFGKADKQ